MPLVHLRRAWQTIHPPFRHRFERLVLPAGFATGQTRTAELSGLFSFFRSFAHTDSSVVPLPDETWNRIIAEIQSFAEIFQSKDEEKMAA